MDDMILKDRNSYVSQHELQADAWLGLSTSVRNRQTIMALDYVVRVLEDLKNQVSDLSAQVEELKSVKASVQKKLSTPRPKKEETHEGDQQ